MNKSLGFMYIAKRPCGKVSAMAWDEPRFAKYLAKDVAKWIARGDTVERIEQHEGDPQPTWGCGESEQCQCRTDQREDA